MRRILEFSILALFAAAMPLGAQAGTDASTTAGARSAGGARSPMAARVIGIVPGAGHMYAGETGRGLAYLGGIAGLVVIDAAALVAQCVAGDGMYSDDGCGSSNVDDVFTAAIIGLWGWSIYDAGRAAQRTNAKHGLRTSLVIAPTRPSGTGQRDVGRGLKIGLRLR
jgi:hypothetical protein